MILTYKEYIRTKKLSILLNKELWNPYNYVEHILNNLQFTNEGYRVYVISGDSILIELNDDKSYNKEYEKIIDIIIGYLKLGHDDWISKRFVSLKIIPFKDEDYIDLKEFNRLMEIE